MLAVQILVFSSVLQPNNIAHPLYTHTHTHLQSQTFADMLQISSASLELDWEPAFKNIWF